MSRALKWTIGLFVFAIATLAVPSARVWTLTSLAGWLDVGEAPKCTRYVFVLPGDEVFRPLTAAALLRVGLAHDVLIPQNPKNADIRDGITPPTAQISRKVLEHRGIPHERIVLLPTHSRTTIDDAQALRDYLREHEGTASVVTSAFHTRRTAYAFRQVFGAEFQRIHIVSAPNPGFSGDDWWKKPEGARLILTEYIKLASYVLQYSGAAISMFLAVIVGCGVVLRQIFRQNQERRGEQRSVSRRPHEDGGEANSSPSQ